MHWLVALCLRHDVCFSEAKVKRRKAQELILHKRIEQILFFTSGGSTQTNFRRVPAPPLKFFKFHAVFRKLWPNNRLTPPLGFASLLWEILDPLRFTVTPLDGHHPLWLNYFVIQPTKKSHLLLRFLLF